MNLGPVFLLSLAAQTQVSLGVGVGTVRYAGGSSFAAASLSPAAHLLRPSSYLGGAASLSFLEDGVWAGQGRADVWAVFTRRSAVQLAISSTISTTTRSDAVAAAAGSLLGEVVYAAADGGTSGGALAVGPAGGVLEGEPGIGALRVRARGWSQVSRHRLQLSAMIESTRLFSAWYHDVVGGMSFDNDRVSAAAWITGRLSDSYGSTGAASASLQYFVTRWIALEVAGGSYLRDPFQALPRGGFGSAGIRLRAAPRPAASTAARPSQRLAPLIAQRRGGGDTVVVRFRMDAEHSLAIAGDWNAWTPIPLSPLGDDIWEAVLVLARGTYHFNLLVDELEWVVPGGVAVLSDGMGGLVAVLTVL